MTTSSTRCPHCGTNVEAGNRFCTQCGRPMEVPPVCSQCGATLPGGSRFCGRCGAAVSGVAVPVEAAPPSAQATPAATGEPVLGVIAGLQRRKGLFGRETFNLIVTPGRLVFALMTDQMMKDAARELGEQAKREGKGLLGRMAAQMGWLGVMAERYSRMPVATALAEHRENFFIPNNTVQRVRFEQQRDDETHRTTHFLKIEAVSGKYSFELLGVDPGPARALLRKVLGAAVK